MYSALPPNLNPSGTATKLSDYNIFSPAAIGRQAEMTAKQSLLRTGKVESGIVGGALKAASTMSPKNVIIKLKQGPGAGYAQALESALARGNDAYAATYFLLQKTDPQFQKIINEDDRQGY
jgi:hypothetical protein